MKLFLICVCLVVQNAQGEADVLAKRDSSAEVDPYAAYYEQYAAHQQDQPNFVAAYADEKQGLGNAMQNIFGDDAGMVLGLVGALAGTAALIGVALNNNNVNLLSKDQDSICTTAKAAGNTAIGTIDVSATVDRTTVNAALKKITDVLDGYATPSC